MNIKEGLEQDIVSALYFSQLHLPPKRWRVKFKIRNYDKHREMPKNIGQSKFYKRRGEINTRISVSIFRNNY